MLAEARSILEILEIPMMIKLTGLATILLAIPAAAQYSARQEGDVVHLEDAKSQTVVSIITSVGNVTFEMKVKGQNVLRFPYASLDDFKARPGLSGIPFLGPWANRLDEQAFYANGKKYSFNMDLGNVRGANPMHGFLTSNNQWQVVEVKADKDSAWVTSRLDFYKQPDWMAQFPFAHTIEMTHRLKDGVLEVHTKVQNLSAQVMPIAIGFHPYFQLTDSPRDEWTVGVAAKTQWLLSPAKIPTGETQPIEKFFPDPQAIALKDYSLDHVFADLVRDASGRATMWVQGKAQRLEVMFGPNFRSVVIYSPSPNASQIPESRGGPPPPGQNPAGANPQGANARGGANPGGNPAAGGNGRGGRGGGGGQNSGFICFEPMVGITDAMNLAQKGLYKELQTLPPGQTWQESFWIRPAGF